VRNTLSALVLSFFVGGCATSNMADNLGSRAPADAGTDTKMINIYKDQFHSATGIEIWVSDQERLNDQERSQIRTLVEWFYKNREEDFLKDKAFKEIRIIENDWGNLRIPHADINVPRNALSNKGRLVNFLGAQLSKNGWNAEVAPLLQKKEELIRQISEKSGYSVATIIGQQKDLVPVIQTLELLDRIFESPTMKGLSFKEVLVCDDWANIEPTNPRIHVRSGASREQLVAFIKKQLSPEKMAEVQRKVEAANSLAGALSKRVGYEVGILTHEPIEVDAAIVTLENLQKIDDVILRKRINRLVVIDEGWVHKSGAGNTFIPGGASPEELTRFFIEQE
jgi:hypothetical protein